MNGYGVMCHRLSTIHHELKASVMVGIDDCIGGIVGYNNMVEMVRGDRIRASKRPC